MKRLVLVALLVLGCTPSLGSGVIISKHDYPAYDYVTMDCAWHDDKGNCEFFMEHWHHVPERWSVTVHGCDDHGCRDQEVGVTQARYEELKMGDEIRLNGALG